MGALLTPARANTVLTATFCTTNATIVSFNGTACSESGVYATAAGYTDLFTSGGASSSPNVGSATPSGLGVGNGGLEMSGGYIGPSDGIVVDFSTVPITYSGQTLSSVAFTLFDVNAGAYYEIYASSAPNGEGVLKQLAEGATVASPGTTVNYSTTSLEDSSTGGSYVVGLSNGDCDLVITGITLAYSVPEPGTFVLGGMALIAIGLPMRKRKQKA